MGRICSLALLASQMLFPHPTPRAFGGIPPDPPFLKGGKPPLTPLHQSKPNLHTPSIAVYIPNLPNTPNYPLPNLPHLIYRPPKMPKIRLAPLYLPI